MDSYASESLASPPLLHHYLHQRFHQQHLEAHASSYTAMIVFPTVAAAIILVGFVLVMILRQPKANGNGSDRAVGSFRKSSYDESKLISNCTSMDKLSLTRFSPDVRSCIYEGKLGFATPASGKGAQVFTYRELQLATDGFSESNAIRNVEFANVYKGTLSDGTLAAIKLFHAEGRQGEREFRMEVDLLTRLHSPYLVALLGYCADQQHRLLVFEYMPNGSLQQRLYPRAHQVRQPSSFLDWRSRLRIALDCARGLEFLHERSMPAVIHRDFNCSNILLDRAMSAKLSGFSLAKACSDKVDGRVKTRVLGASGYIAPEYASTGNITTKSDVYSYGVVLLQLLTGRVPVDTKRPQREQVLVSWALPRLTSREKVEEMVDPALKGQYRKKELVQVAAIAAVCVQPEADYRPLITDVVQSLIPLVRNTSAYCPSTPARFKDDHVSVITPWCSSSNPMG